MSFDTFGAYFGLCRSSTVLTFTRVAYACHQIRIITSIQRAIWSDVSIFWLLKNPGKFIPSVRFENALPAENYTARPAWNRRADSCVVSTKEKPSARVQRKKHVTAAHYFFKRCGHTCSGSVFSLFTDFRSSVFSWSPFMSFTTNCILPTPTTSLPTSETARLGFFPSDNFIHTNFRNYTQ